MMFYLAKNTFESRCRFSCLFFFLGVFCPVVNAEQAPNVVFVLADDLGWSEIGCYGNTFNETPNLDRLATEGMRFTAAYAAAPVCSPYRAALLTGQHPARVGIIDYLRPNSANALPTSLTTLPEILKSHGYATGMVGKWHLTGYQHHDAEFELRPTDHGFEWNIGSEVKGVGNGANFWPYVFRDQPIRWLDLPENRLGEDEYLTDRLNIEAVDFIERSAKQNQPFFLYLSHYAPHTILNGQPQLVEKYIKKHPPGNSSREHCYLCEDAGQGKGDPGHHWAQDHNPHLAAMLESIDHGIGLIDSKLKELEISENTIFIFTSDNGGETNVTSNLPLRGGKSELYEGGIRVPLIVRWPQCVPKGVECQQPTQNVDFLPTLLEAANIKLPENQVLDGVSTLATWKNPEAKTEREFIAWHYPLDHPHFLGGLSAGAIRSGGWKLIDQFDSNSVQLFNLADDLEETTDQSLNQPVITEQLLAQLADWREEVGARIPSPPLLTEQRQLYFAEHFHPEHLSERLWYNADWKAEQGVLKRIKNRPENTRIFLRDAEYKDAMIRFDFRLGDAQDVRLMTGSGGHYNTVLHIHPDHFFLQTAQDSSAPYFSYQHGECAFEFDPDRWYTMTVEFLGDEAIAHLDHEHLVHAQHPMIDRTREYFAIQVDEHAAEFDNVQIFTAVANKSAGNREKVTVAMSRYPVKKSLEEQFDIRKTNAHEWYYQRDETYRNLVLKVDELDEAKKKRFPDAFRTHKEYMKSIQQKRKHLTENDPNYKRLLVATHKSNQAIDNWLISKNPELNDLPKNRQKAWVDQLRSEYAEAPELIALLEKAQQAQNELEETYPELFVTDGAISAMKKAAAEKVKKTPEYKELSQERAEAYRGQQEYLISTDPELKKLNEQLNHSS